MVPCISGTKRTVNTKANAAKDEKSKLLAERLHDDYRHLLLKTKTVFGANYSISPKKKKKNYRAWRWLRQLFQHEWRQVQKDFYKKKKKTITVVTTKPIKKRQNTHNDTFPVASLEKSVLIKNKINKYNAPFSLSTHHISGPSWCSKSSFSGLLKESCSDGRWFAVKSHNTCQ